MNNQEFIKIIQDKHNNTTDIPKVTQAQVKSIIDCMVNIIEFNLKNDVDCKIIGLGMFKPIIAKARNARNPRTGEEIIIPEKKKVTFKISTKLKERLN